jgi:hypothetical protein
MRCAEAWGAVEPLIQRIQEGVGLKKIIVFFLVVFAAALPRILLAKSFYVAPNGDDGNPGTIDAPFATVKKSP